MKSLKPAGMVLIDVLIISVIIHIFYKLTGATLDFSSMLAGLALMQVYKEKYK